MTADSTQNDPELGGMDRSSFDRIKKATSLPDEEIVERFEEFQRQFPSGGMSVPAFRKLSLAVLSEAEVDEFVSNVFKMFDVNKDKTLTFEEFTFATVIHSTCDEENPMEKLSWLFDNVYDKNRSGHITRDELDEILTTLLKMENFPPTQAKELVNDIFNDLDLNRDGLINRREFLIATSQSEVLLQILTAAADKEKTGSGQGAKTEVHPTHATAAIAAASVIDLEEQKTKSKKGKRKSKKKKKAKEEGDDKSLSVKQSATSRRKSVNPSIVNA